MNTSRETECSWSPEPVSEELSVQEIEEQYTAGREMRHVTPTMEACAPRWLSCPGLHLGTSDLPCGIAPFGIIPGGAIGPLGQNNLG